MTPLTQREKVFALCASLCALLCIGVVWWVSAPKPPNPTSFVVQIEGAVNRPGVYEVPEGTRLFELLERAGGTKEDADLRGFNLAAPLYDGQKVTIPTVSPHPEEHVSSPQKMQVSGASRINVNTASSKELETLPGIGPVLAQRIVEYRETHGPFRTPEDLLKVKGIGPRKLENIRDRITF